MLNLSIIYLLSTEHLGYSSQNSWFVLVGIGNETLFLNSGFMNPNAYK